MAIPSYVQVPEVAHGSYVMGDTELRLIWDNVRMLAGDNKTGYGKEGYNIDNGYPQGYATCVYRNQAIETGISHPVPGQVTRIYLRRVKDYLRYRARDCKLIYTDRNGETAEKKLEDCDIELGSANDYRILDLEEINDLTYGTEYYLYVIDSGNFDYDLASPPMLDFAEEID